MLRKMLKLEHKKEMRLKNNMIRKNTSVRNFCNKFNQGLQRAMYADNIKMRIEI